MLPSKTLGLLSVSPLVHCSLNTCRLTPVFSYQQSPAPWNDFRSAGRSNCNIHSTRSSHASAAATSVAYRVGAAFSAKGRRFNTKHDLFSFDPSRQSSERPPFTGRPASGQDAFFISSIANSSSAAFGVADGVGGWDQSGIDSADFSHALCRNLATTAKDHTGEQKLGARDLLSQAFADVVADKDIVGGGSTACVAVGNSTGHLEVANLGDSGFAHFRLNAVHYDSNPQTHAFNTPYQLSIIPPKVLARSRIFGSMPLRDFPEDASVTSHDVRHGDVLVFATDGVWDNLSANELLQIVSRYMAGFQAWQSSDRGTAVGNELARLTKEGGIPKERENSLQTMLAVAITGEAKAASQNSRRDGPFAKEVQKFYPHEEFHGGKVDDICVVVAVVLDASDTGA
ncbi:Protein phosphatase 2C 7 [Xanthoria parietina]